MKITTTRLTYFCILTLFCLPFIFNAQTTFQKVYPTTYDKTTRDVIELSDGYMMVGMSNNSDITDCNLLIMKTDLNGNLLWEKLYGGAKPDYAYGMVQTTDGNFMVTGFTQSTIGGVGNGDFNVYVIKFDPSGNKIWEKAYGSFNFDEGREIISLGDGTYVIAGTTSSSTGGNGLQAFLRKIDNDGNEIWVKHYGGLDKEYGNGVKLCSDNGFILTGQTMSFGPAGGNTYLVRTNSSGDTLWTKYYSTSGSSDEGVGVVNNTDGSFVVAVRDSNSNDIDTRILKVDANGSQVWNKVYGGNMKDTPKTIHKTTDGGYIVGSISRSFGWVNPDMWLLKVDAAGDTTWSRHFGASDHEHAHHTKQTSDGGFIAAGHSRSYSPGQKVMLVKMNGSGVVSVKNHLANKGGILNVYPNPSSDGKFLIKGMTNKSQLKVTNALGQVVYSGIIDPANSETEILDLSKNAEGLYLISVESDVISVSRKIIVRK